MLRNVDIVPMTAEKVLNEAELMQLMRHFVIFV